jgi:drug/metabolite transporter (DMT)-like permease
MSSRRVAAPAVEPSAHDVGRGLALGALGVLVFALSIPMTRLATGPQAVAPGALPLPAEFVAIGRAVVAGLLGAAYLAWVRAPWPTRAQWPLLACTAAGVVFGWPLFLGWAVVHVDAVHASVVSGLLPLATAAIGAVWLRQRPSLGFWLSALAGTALVVAFAAWRGGGGLQAADGLLLAAVLCSATGYVSGARLSLDRPPQQVISWVLVLSLPLTVPLAWSFRPTAAATAVAWGGFLYLGVFSMWLGFFAWYRALALGGTVRVSQVQLLQPFASMLLAVPLLGESLDTATLLFALAVLGCVWAGRRMPTEGRGASNNAATRPTP